jgi:hypothetical protein
MVPQEPLLCRQLFCFITITIVLPTQNAQLNPLPPLQCETHTGPYPDPRFSVLPLFYMQQEALTRFGHGTPQHQLVTTQLVRIYELARARGSRMIYNDQELQGTQERLAFFCHIVLYTCHRSNRWRTSA